MHSPFNLTARHWPRAISRPQNFYSCWGLELDWSRVVTLVAGLWSTCHSSPLHFARIRSKLWVSCCMTSAKWWNAYELHKLSWICLIKITSWPLIKPWPATHPAHRSWSARSSMWQGGNWENVRKMCKKKKKNVWRKWGVLWSIWILIGRIRAETTNNPNKLTKHKKGKFTGSFQVFMKMLQIEFLLRFAAFRVLWFLRFVVWFWLIEMQLNLSSELENFSAPFQAQIVFSFFFSQRGTKLLEKRSLFLTKSNNNCRKRKCQVLVLLLYFAQTTIVQKLH